jgi:SulP family sulfate permease
MKRFQLGDLMGGVASSAVVLPQALAFGVALLAPFGFDPASGALAGLIATAALNVSTGLAGGTQGMISAPTGPTLMLQLAAMAALAASGLEGPDLLVGMAAVIVCAGVFQTMIGLSGGGQIVKYLPYPVTAGFIIGVGILMILSQVDPIVATVDDPAWHPWSWLPLATAAVTIGAIYLAPRLLPRIPGTISGLVTGIVFFQIVAAFGPGPVPSQWVIGRLPDVDAIETGLRAMDVGNLPWLVIVSSALALAVLASIDTLLTSVQNS